MRQQLIALSLKPDPSLGPLSRLAAAAQSHRSQHSDSERRADTHKTTRTTALAAACWLDSGLRQIVFSSGDSWSSFLQAVALDDFERPQSLPEELVDSDVHQDLRHAMEQSRQAYPKRRYLDLSGLVFGILQSVTEDPERGRLGQRLEKSGVSAGDVLATLTTFLVSDDSTLRQAIAQLGLSPDPELDRLIPLAWHAQQHRSSVQASRVATETFASRPSLFYAAAQTDRRIWPILERTGLDRERFSAALGLESFSPTDATEPEDLAVHPLILRGLEIFRRRFPRRQIVDALAIAYGLTASAKAGLQEHFKTAGGDLEQAAELLTSRIESPPSARIHSDRWTLEDHLGYSLYARAITDFIQHPETAAPLAISIEAPWGQGKTSLMRMVHQQIDPEHPDFATENPSDDRSTSERPSFQNLLSYLQDGFNPQIERLKRPTVWFNPWKYQSSDELWAGLAHAILSQLPARLSVIEREKFWLKLQLSRVNADAVRADIQQAALKALPELIRWPLLAVALFFFLGVAIAIFGSAILDGQTQGVAAAVGTLVSGGSLALGWWRAFGAWTEAKSQALSQNLDGSYESYLQQPDYVGRAGFLHLVGEDMGNALHLLVDPDAPAVIFIDDLDRCSPEKVAQVVEAVNLFLAHSFVETIFVIGLDAQVVAASMEVVHQQIIDKLEDRRGDLGWRFLDKFIQLPFVIPRMSTRQQATYLQQLLAVSEAAEPPPEEIHEQVERLEAQFDDGEVGADLLRQQVQELAPQLEKQDRDQYRRLAERALTVAAQEFQDDDREMLAELKRQAAYLSDNPRTIKRVVNLYRFHRFMSWARSLSGANTPGASPAQIARWVVVIVRWPHFVRWIQASLEGGGSDPAAPLSRVVNKARESPDARAWAEALTANADRSTGGSQGQLHGWGGDRDLWRFLHQRVSSDLEIAEASRYGLW